MQKSIMFLMPLGIDFWVDVNGFWIPKWSQVGTKMGSKINVNFERRFFKQKTNLEEKPCFLRSKRSKLGANIDQKSIKKRSPRWDASWHRFFTDFGWFWEPCWEAKSNKNRSKTVSKKRLKKEGQQDGQQDAPRAYEGAIPPPSAQGEGVGGEVNLPPEGLRIVTTYYLLAKPPQPKGLVGFI